MNTKTLTLALSTLAVLSTSGAYAQHTAFRYDVASPEIQAYPAVAGCNTLPAVIDSNAVLGSNALIGSSALIGSNAVIGNGAWLGNDMPLFGKRTWFDNRMHGYGMGLGSGYNACGYGCGVNTLSAVIPNGGGITAVSGQRRANAAIDLRLFGFGFGFGTVSPRLDNRPAGWSH